MDENRKYTLEHLLSKFYVDQIPQLLVPHYRSLNRFQILFKGSPHLSKELIIQ